MDNAPLISVIVPVYNVEPYLDRCVQSIVDQTYTNLEIILVDDGSPDNCPAMCDAWAEKDSRIKVIHKENGGLSDARNAGMAEATGEYVAFIDSDDWVAIDFLKTLYSEAIRSSAQIVECDYAIADNQGINRVVHRENYICVDTYEALQLHFDGKLFFQVVWNKLYHREILTVLFEKGKYHEDEFWTYQIIANCQTLSHIGLPLYYYYQRDESIMGEGYSLKRLDAVEAKARRQTFLEKNMPSLAAQGRISLFFTCLYHGQLALRDLKGAEQKQAVKRLKETIKSQPLTREDKKRLSFTHRLWAEMSRISFVLTCRVRNLLQTGY